MGWVVGPAAQVAGPCSFCGARIFYSRAASAFRSVLLPNPEVPMDVTFICPSCKQQLEAPTSLSGTAINCPACNNQIVIPEADPANFRTPGDGNAARLEEKHFVVPVTESPTQSLIKKALP